MFSEVNSLIFLLIFLVYFLISVAVCRRKTGLYDCRDAGLALVKGLFILHGYCHAPYCDYHLSLVSGSPPDSDCDKICVGTQPDKKQKDYDYSASCFVDGSGWNSRPAAHVEYGVRRRG